MLIEQVIRARIRVGAYRAGELEPELEPGAEASAYRIRIQI